MITIMNPPGVYMSKTEIIRSYYDPKLDADLPDFGKLGWESAEAQELRFAAFVDNADLEGKSILDVGCGLGNLLEYMTARNINTRYTGVDILPRMIDCARDKKICAEFHCVDIFRENPFGEKSFDAVYASGIFNLNLGNNHDFFLEALCRFSHIAREVIAFNLLDHRSPNKENEYFYFSASEVIDLIESTQCKPRKVQIIEQYLQNDFTVVCTL